MAFHELQITGDGNCAYNAFAVALCYEFQLENEDGHWHRWLRSEKAGHFLNLCGVELNQATHDAVAFFKHFLDASNWIERQKILAKVFRLWNYQLLKQKFADAYLAEKARNSYQATIVNTAIRLALDALPELTDNESYFEILDRRLQNILSQSLNQRLIETILKSFQTQKELIDAHLKELYLLQQEQQNAEKQSVHESQICNLIQNNSQQLVETISSFIELNLEDVIESFKENGRYIGIDELAFLAEATETKLKLSLDGETINAASITINDNYRPAENAPSIVLHDKNGHYNLWVDDHNGNALAIIEAFNQEPDIKASQQISTLDDNSQTKTLFRKVFANTGSQIEEPPNQNSYHRKMIAELMRESQNQQTKNFQINFDKIFAEELQKHYDQKSDIENDSLTVESKAFMSAYRRVKSVLFANNQPHREIQDTSVKISHSPISKVTNNV